MFPQSGYGFIWDKVSIREDRAETTLFVPESKKVFVVSISVKDIDKRQLHPTEWIRWKDVGVRDAALPFPLIDASLMDGSHQFLQPEFSSNQTVFRSILIFPDREDLVAFVGEHNAWSPHVGIVVCDGDAEITRGVYCVGYIERDYDKTESSFRVITDKLKFPDGFISDRDKKDYEGLAREIELAMEEARILASKGRKHEEKMIPIQQRVHNTGGFDEFTENCRVVKTKASRPGWKRGKTKEQIEYIEIKQNFIKNHRYNEIIVYKKSSKGSGFVGWAPLLGSVAITTHFHKTSDRRVEVGHTIKTRVEYIPQADRFEVDTIDEFVKVSKMPYNIHERNGRVELIIRCEIDLKDFTPLNRYWNEKKVGVINHQTLIKILVYEEIALDERWKDKRVSALLVHYEDIERETPSKIRLILKRIEGLCNENSSEKNAEETTAEIQSGRPDEVDSDSEEEEEEDGLLHGENNRDNESNPMECASAFRNYNSGKVFDSRKTTYDRRENVGRSERKERGREFGTNERIFDGQLRGGSEGRRELNDSDRGMRNERGETGVFDEINCGQFDVFDNGGFGRFERGRGGRRGGVSKNQRRSPNQDPSYPSVNEGHGFGEMNELRRGINHSSPAFQVDEEDEIDRWKREAKERSEQRRAMKGNEDEDWNRVDKKSHYSNHSSQMQNGQSNFEYFHRGNDYSNDEGNQRARIPSRYSSKAPSIESVSTQLTSTTVKSDKALQRELDNMKRLLKSVWGYKEVQKIVKADNYFLFESVDELMIQEAEDKSEKDNWRIQ